MPLNFVPNLTLLYNEVEFLDRFGRAAAAGFEAVEFQFPYEAGIEAVRARVEALGLGVVLFNLHRGDVAAGEWGTLSNPARRDYFRWSLETALEGAARLGCGRLNVLFGQRVSGVDAEAQVSCALENLAWAAPQAAQAGVTLLIEPLNPTDFPDAFIHHTRTAVDVVNAAGQPNVKVQYDVYHAQMAEGNLSNTLTTYFALIGHVQIADVPGRHEPGTGEINYPAVFATLERLDYQGFIGLEYRPSSDTDASLEWLPREAGGAGGA
ncbi:MAG TPA: TIM barrel protein [Ardenticatenaceae bacterium]|nr:TIM barrel protein [Ardenticatenaceae bacterium]